MFKGVVDLHIFQKHVNVIMKVVITEFLGLTALCIEGSNGEWVLTNFRFLNFQLLMQGFSPVSSAEHGTLGTHKGIQGNALRRCTDCKEFWTLSCLILQFIAPNFIVNNPQRQHNGFRVADSPTGASFVRPMHTKPETNQSTEAVSHLGSFGLACRDLW